MMLVGKRVDKNIDCLLVKHLEKLAIIKTYQIIINLLKVVYPIVKSIDWNPFAV